jgi:hypothetical protein
VLVRKSGPFTLPGVLRSGLDRDLLGHLEAEDKVRVRCVEQLRPVLLIWELVKRQVAADCRERKSILGQALFLELGFGELAPRDVSIA